MQFIKYLSLSVILSANTLNAQTPEPVVDQPQINTAEQLIQTALKSDLGFSIVESLTTEIGPRLAGSEAEERARTWGKALGKKLGFDKVSIEQ